MSDSFYDQFANDDTPPPAIKSETPHANRENLSKPYVSDLTTKAASAPTERIKTTSANNEWMKFICNRNSPDYIAVTINREFNRNEITGDNFNGKKKAYLARYKSIENKLIKEQ